MSQFPWEVTNKNLKGFFEGPYLFSALYRVYQGAYFGQGFQLDRKLLEQIHKEFYDRFAQLPLDLKAKILSKLWDQGRTYNHLIVHKGELYLPIELHFLFAQYGRLKKFTQPILSMGCGAWNGRLIERRMYSFEYGPPNLRGRFLISDFLSSEPYYIPSPCFGLLCP